MFLDFVSQLRVFLFNVCVLFSLHACNNKEAGDTVGSTSSLWLFEEDRVDKQSEVKVEVKQSPHCMGSIRQDQGCGIDPV